MDCASSFQCWWMLLRLLPYVRTVISALILFAFFSTITGCITVGPDFVPPDTAAPETWAIPLQGGLSDEEINQNTLASWWEILDDPDLSNLIECAIANNLDLKKARARISEVRARYGIAKADMYPTLRTTGSASRNHTSKKTGGATNELYRAGFDAGWELDFFGGKQRAIEAAESELQVSKEDLHDVLVSLVAEVALNYVDVRALQTRLSIAEANYHTQKETSDITTWRCKAGLTTQLDVEQARFNLKRTYALIPDLRTSIKQAENRLTVLLGQSPGALNDTLSERKAIPVTPLKLAVGVPADTLRCRPDVRRAEQVLAASTARVGVAVAERFPKFNLPGSIGLESLSIGDLFSSGALISSITPNISWTIFDGGRIRQNIEVQSALQEQALIKYESVIQKALEEVENALVAYAEEQIRRHSLLEAVEAAARAVSLARCQYETGLTDFQTVLNTQRSLLSLQEQLAKSEGTITSNLIRIYKALGGGWTPMTRSAIKSNK